MNGDEFVSVGGSYIKLGHFKNKTIKDQHGGTYASTGLYHSGSRESLTSDGRQPAQMEQGLSTTRFGKGFQRRQVGDIRNPFSEEQQRQMAANERDKVLRKQIMTQSRSQLLKDVDAKTGYNLLTHEARGNGPVTRVEGKVRIIPGQGEEVIHRGKQTLKDTGGRYFLPLGSGPTHEYREAVLYKEGINSGKFTSIIQPGKKDLPSYGIEDQFSKSEYHATSEVTKNGLYESRLPGRYTPRKQANHPSGDSQILNQWASNVDLNNNATRALQQQQEQSSRALQQQQQQGQNSWTLQQQGQYSFQNRSTQLW